MTTTSGLSVFLAADGRPGPRIGASEELFTTGIGELAH